MHHSTTLMCHCEERSDVAISGRHLQPVQAIADRMQYCRGGDSRTRHCTGGKCGLILKRQWPPSLSLRGGQRPTWQSREGTADSYRAAIKRENRLRVVSAMQASNCLRH